MSKHILAPEDLKKVEGLSVREAAKVLGVGKSTVGNARKYYEAYVPEPPKRARILTIDIESKPHTAYVWGLWDQNVGLPMLIEAGGMMCFAAKWLGDDHVFFFSEFQHGKNGMLGAVHTLLSEADVVVTYNGDRYDIKRLNNEFLLNGYPPPAPYKSIDIIKTNKGRFDLPSRKLDYLVQSIGVGAKEETGGFQLWLNCMAGDEEAWAKMEFYNRGDVLVTEKAYLTLLPWLANPPHMGMWNAIGESCPYCPDGGKLVESGIAYTLNQAYIRYRCENCGGWARGTTRLQNAITTRAIK